MKGILIGILVVTIVLGLEFTTESESAVAVEAVAPAAGPQREPYRAPVWVTNDRGQRCIQQGITVTCG